jgi:hypothetical protein
VKQSDLEKEKVRPHWSEAKCFGKGKNEAPLE